MSNVNLEQELSDIFESVPTGVETEVELPSKGLFYKPIIDKVKIKPIVFEDQKTLVMAKKSKGNVLNVLLERSLIDVPNGFVSNLVLIDKIFLLIKIREVSFSKEYKAAIVCPKCQEQYEVSIAIDEIPINYYDKKEGNDPIEIFLPGIQKTAKVSVARCRNEDYFSQSEDYMLNNLWRSVVEIGGKTNTLVITKALDKLSLVDITTIIQAVTLTGYGVDPKFEYSCSDERCQYKGILAIPLTEDFFTMRSLDLET